MLMGIDEWVDNWRHLGVDKFLVLLLLLLLL